MSILYIIAPLNQTLITEEHKVALLREHGIALPAIGSQGRWPTITELRQALDGLVGCEVEYGCGVGNFQATVLAYDDERQPDERLRGACSPIYVLHFNNDENQQIEFYFESGWPNLHILILKRLARRCGPYLMLGDVDVPIVINADTDLNTTFKVWNEACERRWQELELLGDAEESSDA